MDPPCTGVVPAHAGCAAEERVSVLKYVVVLLRRMRITDRREMPTGTVIRS